MPTPRRAPQQERGERRLAQLLKAAEALLAEVGYEAATMTGIADRAKASIGTLYQYFPNKESLVLALRGRYSGEMEARWAHLDQEATAASPAREIARQLIEVMNRFVLDHPATFPILDAPVKFPRNQEARNRLRERMAGLFRRKRPELSAQAAYRMAQVSIQILKSLYLLLAEAEPQEREELVQEYQFALAAYLESRL
jgi:AcrR family transcriptional regulator